MSINVWGYLDEFAEERDEIMAAVEGVFRSGTLIHGEAVAGFEREFAAYHGVEHCVGVDNGTNAVALALKALGIGPGDEVITVSNTAAPTVVAIVAAGATPVFVDVRAQDYLMDVELLEQAITDRTRAIVVVQLYGQCAQMGPLLQIAAKHDLKVVEDCAQAHGATHHGRTAGTFGDAAAFSFYPTKVLGAYGDGGAVLTGSTECATNLRQLRYYGMAEQYYVVNPVGHNSRLDEVQAAILRTKLLRLNDYIAARQRIADVYLSELAEWSAKGLVLPRPNPGNTHVYYVFVVRHPRRDDIMALMRERGVNLNISYPWPIHTMSGYQHLGWEQGSLPVTEALAGQIFSLPMFPSLDLDRQKQVIEAMHESLELIGK